MFFCHWSECSERKVVYHCLTRSGKWERHLVLVRFCVCLLQFFKISGKPQEKSKMAYY